MQRCDAAVCQGNSDHNDRKRKRNMEFQDIAFYTQPKGIQCKISNFKKQQIKMSEWRNSENSHYLKFKFNCRENGDVDISIHFQILPKASQ